MSVETGVRRVVRRGLGLGLVAVSMLVSSQVSAQGAACSVIAHRNVTMFERMVAEKIAAGWEVKGGIAFFESGGWTVLMCSR